MPAVILLPKARMTALSDNTGSPGCLSEQADKIRIAARINNIFDLIICVEGSCVLLRGIEKEKIKIHPASTSMLF